MNFTTGIAKEKLINNTICVREGDFIRNMKFNDDCLKSTVFISNIAPCDKEEDEYFIKIGEYVRCMEVAIVPKISWIKI
jgi:hypothetical protein